MFDACACVCRLADRWLKHPHVVKFRELFLTERHICIAMEFANGGNLFKQVGQGCGMVRLLQAYSPQSTAVTPVRKVWDRAGYAGIWSSQPFSPVVCGMQTAPTQISFKPVPTAGHMRPITGIDCRPLE